MSPFFLSMALLAWAVGAVAVLFWLSSRRARKKRRSSAEASAQAGVEGAELACDLTEGMLRGGRQAASTGGRSMGGGGFHTSDSFGAQGFRVGSGFSSPPMSASEAPLLAAALDLEGPDSGQVEAVSTILDFDVGGAAEAVFGGVSEAVGAGLEVAGEAAAGIASAVLE